MNRESYIDVLKGVAICAVVTGHASALLHDFVYTWHLAVFIFVMGYLYNKNKYADCPWEYLGHKVGSNWTKYVSCSLVIIVLYLFVKKFGYLEGDILGKREIFREIINIIFFGGGISLQGTLWFIPMMLLCTGMFCGIIYWKQRIRVLRDREWPVLIFSLVIGFVGLWITNRGSDLKAFLNLSMIMLPICAAGYWLRENGTKFEGVSIPVGIAAGVGNLLAAYILNWNINLAFNMTAGYKFYFVSAVGIYMALAIAKILKQFKVTRTLFSFLGRYSFEVMAFHFSVFKIIDMIYGNVFLDKVDYQVLSAFPTSGAVNTGVYVLLGCVIPVAMGYLAENVLSRIRRKYYAVGGGA